MLEARDISLQAGVRADGEPLWLLRELSAHFPRGHFCAVVGPSGSGKSTLLKVIAGLREPQEGSVHWEGRDLQTRDLEPNQIGYVPQFGISFDLLSVRESVSDALQLRVGGLSRAGREERVENILAQTGLGEIAERRGAVLSGGQKRRLALALEMAAEPMLLLCDEVTSGLDMKSEDEIVRLMRRLAHDGGNRTVLSVTHSLRHLEAHDSVAVLNEGRLVYHGAPELLPHYFSIAGPEHLFDALAAGDSEGWHASWRKHRASYYASMADADLPVLRAADPLPAGSGEEEEFLPPPGAGHVEGAEEEAFEKPRWVTQFRVLLRRQRKLLLRDRGHSLLQLALLFGFPCLVVIFAWDGLPQIQNLTEAPSQNALQQVLENASFPSRPCGWGGWCRDWSCSR